MTVSVVSVAHGVLKNYHCAPCLGKCHVDIGINTRTISKEKWFLLVTTIKFEIIVASFVSKFISPNHFFFSYVPSRLQRPSFQFLEFPWESWYSQEEGRLLDDCAGWLRIHCGVCVSSALESDLKLTVVSHQLSLGKQTLVFTSRHLSAPRQSP